MRSVCSLRALLLIVPSRYFRYPSLIFKLLSCPLCDLSRKPMWARLLWIALLVLANTPRWAQNISQTMKKIRLMMAHVLCHGTGAILRKTLRRCGICSRTLPPINFARFAITPRRNKFDIFEVQNRTLTERSVLVTLLPPNIGFSFAIPKTRALEVTQTAW